MKKDKVKTKSTKRGRKRGRESFLIDSKSLRSDEHGVAWKRLKSFEREVRRDPMEPLFRVCQIDDWGKRLPTPLIVASCRVFMKGSRYVNRLSQV